MITIAARSGSQSRSGLSRPNLAIKFPKLGHECTGGRWLPIGHVVPSGNPSIVKFPPIGRWTKSVLFNCKVPVRAVRNYRLTWLKPELGAIEMD
jgi:hypothetical protein